MLRKKLYEHYQGEGRSAHQQRFMYCLSVEEHRIRMQLLKKLLSRVINDSILLDLGCSEGWYTAWTSEKANHAVGTDLSLPRLRRAVQESNTAKTSYVLADWDFLPFKEGSIDIVLWTEGPEHSLNPNKTLAEIYRVTGEGGLLVTSTCCIWPDSVYHRLIRSKLRKRVKRKVISTLSSGHLTDFTPSSLRQILSRFIIQKEIYLNMPKIDLPLKATFSELLRKRLRMPTAIIVAKK